MVFGESLVKPCSPMVFWAPLMKGVGVRGRAVLEALLGTRGELEETHGEVPVVARTGSGLRSRLSRGLST
eukprot:5576225-Alexandrium_andersonii.AAC.1